MVLQKYYSLYYLTNEPISLFGVRFGETPNDNYMIDSSFLYSFLQIGIVACVIITLLNLGMIWEYTCKERKIELAIIVSFCVLGLSDPFLYNLSYKNLLFLFIGALFYEKLQEARSKDLGIFNREIRWFKVGGKEIVVEKKWYIGARQKIGTLQTVISHNTLLSGVVYLLSAALITGCVYLTTFSSHVVDKVDQVEEWEYVRGGLSLGLWGAIIPVAAVLFQVTKKGKRSNTGI